MSTMKNHLKNIHKKLNSDKANVNKKRQTTLSLTYKSKDKLGAEKWSTIIRALALACAVDLRPVSMVMGWGFRYFCNQLNPDYQVPHYNTVIKHLMLLHDEQKKELVEMLVGNQVSFTTDCWTATGSRAYITITAHCITEDWIYKSFVIATRPLDDAHTGQIISGSLEDIAEEFSIDKLVALTTDNASNMRAAGSFMNLIHKFCFSHTLQLATDGGLKIGSIAKATAKASKLVAFFNRSSKATHALDTLQVEEDGKKRSLIQSVPTRWNSTYLMMERLLALRIPVIRVLFNTEIIGQKNRGDLDLTDQQWAILEEITPVLAPFAKATEALTKEDIPTISGEPILLHQLINVACATSDADHPIAVKLSRMN